MSARLLLQMINVSDICYRQRSCVHYVLQITHINEVALETAKSFCQTYQN